MSIASEISRLMSAKGDIKTAIESKGVSVPSAATLDQYPSYVDAIQQGGTLVAHPAPSISLNSGTGLITATHTQAAGEVAAGTTSATLQMTTQGAQTITPTTTAQTIASNTYLTGTQTIAGDAALASGNIKSGVTIFGVTGNYAPALQSKTFTPTSAGSTLTPDEGYYGLSQVTVSGSANLVAGNIKSGVNVFGVVGTYNTPSQSKSFTPTSAGSTIVPDTGYLLSQVTVSGDANLVAGNIKSDVTIFGVTGTYGGGGGGGNTYMAEYLNGTLSEVYDSQATKIGVSGFLLYAQALKSVEMTNISQITSNSAFANCTNLEYISMPNVTSIFSASTNSTAASRFCYSATKLKSAYFPKLTSTPVALFYRCEQLTTIDLTSAQTLAAYTFYLCYQLTSIDLPNVQYISGYCFGNCYNLASISLPKVASINGNQVFAYCSQLTTLSFPSLAYITGNSVFVGCTNLKSLYLMSTARVNLASRSVFNGGPFSSGGTGTIYVPASLYDSYLSSANWFSFSARLSSI